ncbi:hypothetical protein SE17_08420 [Kouleothrix aurantiaca]|uniref:Winged helix-turn-helix domain-containing protein n=1 Tax=Kouleothrix aurantiaca TaxID=186479 RepID=A0A0P9DCZ5_9CHLR|nr:hypothetical protein SE17_08420 [Kouleothrix aurantiaca]
MAESCVRLDGLPLALALAAARVRLLAPAELLGRLSAQSPLRLLRANARDTPARQQTLWQAIEWSETLLSAELRAAFARLSMFVGGCTADAAAAVLGGDFAAPGSSGLHEALDILDILSELIDFSLLRQQLGSDGVPRFQMLETIRAFAREQLAARGEIERVRHAHAVFYLQLAEQAGRQFQGAEQSIWLARLECEHDNLRAALAWCLDDDHAMQVAGKGERHGDGEHREEPAMRPPSSAHAFSRHELGLRLAAALWPFWVYHGDIGEADAWLHRALAKPSAAAPTIVRAEALNGAGFFKMRRGNLARATELLEESLAIYNQFGDKRGSAWA